MRSSQRAALLVAILVTDGEETCGGNPAAAIEKLRKGGINVRVNIVGFAVDDRETAAPLSRPTACVYAACSQVCSIEQAIWRETDNSALRIYTTTDLTSRRIYTLMHDPQYRMAISWQNVAYNQPPHPSLHIGDGMVAPPTPDIRLIEPSMRRSKSVLR